MTQLYNAGLYVTHAVDLFDLYSFTPTFHHVKSWIESAKVQEEVAKFHAGTRDGGLKAFVIKYVDPNEQGVREYSQDDPLVSLVNPKVQEIVEQAIGPAKCICLDLWHNPEGCDKKEQVWSQAWHRDPEDSSVVKVFVYFSDVDEESGPFEYVLGSHLAWFDLCPPCRYPEQPISTETIPAQLFAKVTGGPGTVAFCNTSGLHKGGHGSKSRTMAVLTYVCEGSPAKTLYKVVG